MFFELDYDKEVVFRVFCEIREKGNFDVERVDKIIVEVENVKNESEVKEVFKKDVEIYFEVRNRLIDKMFDELVEVMYGFVGVDLVVFVREVVMVVFRRFIKEGKISFE